MFLLKNQFGTVVDIYRLEFIGDFSNMTSSCAISRCIAKGGSLKFSGVTV